MRFINRNYQQVELARCPAKIPVLRGSGRSGAGRSIAPGRRSARRIRDRMETTGFEATAMTLRFCGVEDAVWEGFAAQIRGQPLLRDYYAAGRTLREAADAGARAVPYEGLKPRSRSAFVSTDTLLIAMAADASTGDNSQPVNG